MHLRSIPAKAAVLWVALQGPGLVAQAPARSAPKPTVTSLQAQISALREGQEKLQKDLEEVKALLRERPARVESPTVPKARDLITLNVTGEPFRGDALARVAILEYSDFDCSFCAKYATEIYPLIEQAYIKAGKVKYFFRDLPGPEHPNALFKARVARCAGDQDRFWEAHDHLFRDQRPFDGPRLLQFARDLALDEPRFQACLSSNQYIDAIQRSANTAARARINGTPAFLIGTLSEDGKVLQAVKVFLGAESFETFRAALDDLLKPADPQAKAVPAS